MHGWELKKMANGKPVDVILITRELLKWTMPYTHHWIIIDQAIKQGLPNDWLVNWTKTIYKVSNYCTIMER